MATRFGADGLQAHRLARGMAERGVSRRQIPEELTVEQVCDPPLDRVDTAAFAARALAERFHSRLADAGLACTRLAITAVTERDANPDPDLAVCRTADRRRPPPIDCAGSSTAGSLQDAPSPQVEPTAQQSVKPPVE